MSSVLKYSELNGRCLAILRLGGTKVDDDLGVEVISSSTESTEAPQTSPPTTTSEPESTPEPEPVVTSPAWPPLPVGPTEGKEKEPG